MHISPSVYLIRTGGVVVVVVGVVEGPGGGADGAMEESVHLHDLL